MMEDHDVAEIVLKDGKTTIEVKRNKENRVPHSSAGADRTDAVQAETGGTAEGRENRESDALITGEKNNEKYHVIEAPLVGTFYRSPAPDEESFVEVGDQVNSGDVLCILEAMKSMNEIQADVSGVVKEICADNAELVEFEQPLFKIEKNV
jgi:acetyl-CoA carboxylase biotin carboxyl carrier protein